MPTEQELSEKTTSADDDYSELSAVQFASGENTAAAVEEAPVEPSPPQEENAKPDYILNAEREQEEITKRDREILEALDRVLRGAEEEKTPEKRKKRPAASMKLAAVTALGSGCGFVSMTLTLIMMAVALLILLFSGSEDFSLLLKLSPAAAIFFGTEILLSRLITGSDIKINVPCTIVTVLITVACIALYAALSKNIAETEHQMSNRSAQSFIYEESYSKLKKRADILKLNVEVNLNLENGKKRIAGELLPADDIDIIVELDGHYSTPLEFAEECSRIIDVYKDLEIPVDNFRFNSDTRLTSFALNVEGKFQQEFSAQKLSSLVRFVYLEDYDFIHDLEDFTEETDE